MESTIHPIQGSPTVRTRVTVRERTNFDQTVNCDLSVYSQSWSARLKQGAKVLGICWGIAFACLLVPVFHFVLVPLGLIIGAVFAFLSSDLRHRVGVDRLQCPKCSSEVPVKAQVFNWPLRVVCEQCQCELIADPNV